MRGRDLFWLTLVATLPLACATRSQSGRVASVPAPTEPAASQVPEAAPQLPAPQPAQEPLPEADPEPLVPEADPLQTLLGTSMEGLNEATQLFEEGDRERGRLLLSDLLLSLKQSGFDFATYPEVQDLYYTILDQLHTLEVSALIESTDGLLPDIVPTPLDEISRYNIFALEVDPALGSKVEADLRLGRFDIPMVVNKPVLQFLEYYQGRGRGITESGLKRSGRYIAYFKEVFAREGVPLDLIYVPHVESLFKPTAYSRAHAVGVWQFVAGTARIYDLKVGWWVDERRNVELSTVAAARHLRDLHDRFGDWFLALAAYNAGPGRVSRVLKRYGKMDYWTMVQRRLLPRDTRHYVPAILASILIYKNPEKYGFDVTPDLPLGFETVPVQHQFDLRVLAEELGVDVKHLEELNPELRRGITPLLDEPYPLRIPQGLADQALERMATIAPSKRIRVRHHRVGSGDTLWDIARAYGTSVEAIRSTNRLRNPNRLRLGQELLIPTRGPGPSVKTGAAGSNAAKRSASTPSGSYTVRRGDSLYRIARRFGLGVDELAQMNSLNKAHKIYPGQRLQVN